MQRSVLVEKNQSSKKPNVEMTGILHGNEEFDLQFCFQTFFLVLS